MTQEQIQIIKDCVPILQKKRGGFNKRVLQSNV